MNQTPAATVSATPSRLSLAWPDGTASQFASVWLRDNISENRDPHSGQRLVDVVDFPEVPLIERAAIRGADLHLSWQDPHPPSTFALDWLRACASGSQLGPEHARWPWLQAADLRAERDFPWLSWQQLRNDAGARLEWLTKLLQLGLGFVRDVPCIENTILEAMSIVGRVAETDYGRLFDVRTVAQPENLAYSDRGLGLHADNPYREPVPGFQALHAIVAAPEGGENLFADGFALAEQLREHAPDDFALLAATPVPFGYRSTGAELYAERPLIELSCNGAVAAVAYNSRSILPLRLPPAQCARFYAAYRRFARLLREPRFQLTMRLQAGELALFDNRRILHGRTAFTSARYPRHLQGCYLTRDSVYSETALLRRRLQHGAGA